MSLHIKKMGTRKTYFKKITHPYIIAFVVMKCSIEYMLKVIGKNKDVGEGFPLGVGSSCTLLFFMK